MTDLQDGQEFYDEGYEDDEQSLNDRIVFSKDSFYGRQEELETLHALYTRLCTQATVPSSKEALCAAESPVTVIGGYSGTGKSALVYRFVEELDGRSKEGLVKPFFFLAGKYEELQRDEPFTGIVEALSGFCRYLLQEDQKANLERVRESIKEALGSEANALVTLIPDLKDIIGFTQNESLSSAASGDTWNRLRYLFQKFLGAICNENCPVIMFLDDLQWTDLASFELIGSLLKDKSSHHFMFIGAVRANEINKGHKLNKLLESVEATGKTVEKIDLLNLSIDDIDDFVAGTLHVEVEKTRPLTEVIYGKTRGNIFFARQVLEELQRANVLYYSLITFSWEWNLDGVELEAGLSDNVIDAVAAKIQSAPVKLQKALKIASYTRSTIDIETLKTLMLEDGCEVDSQELVRLLDIAVLEGLLLNNVGSQNYRFAHDRFQQASYSLVPSGPEREKLRLLIGNRLYHLTSTDAGEDWMVFVAADHLNYCTNNGEDSLMLAKLNLSCGEKACTVAAYVPASVYLRLALKSIRKIEGHWKTQYELSLRLFRATCDTDLCLGRDEDGWLVGQEVINNAENLQDRLPTFLSLAIAKGRQERHAEAMQLCQTALLELGAVPKRFHAAHMLKDNQVVKRLLKKFSDYEILVFPKMKNEKKLATVQFLVECALRAYHCGNLVEYMFCVLRNLRITFKYGLCGGSAQAFAGYGLFLDGACGDHDGGLRMARLARQVLERTDSKPHKALTLLTVGHYIEAWSCPRDKLLETGQQAHRAGMACGNIEMGFQNWVLSNSIAWAAGYPLDPVERNGREMVEQLQLYNVDSVLNQMLEMRIPIRYLLGRADRPLDWSELETFSVEPGNCSETYRVIAAYMGRLELAVFFGEFLVAGRLSDKLQPHCAHDASYLIVSRNLFFSGITFSGLARKTGSRKYITRAAGLAKKMKKISRTKGLNTLHKYLLMEADILACRTKHVDKLMDAYDSGITAALKIGYMQDAALGSEIAGEFFLSMGNELRARQYLCQARDLYREWGAVAKVDSLVANRGSYVETSTSDTAMSSGAHGWTLADFSESRKSIDLDLLSGTTPRTELPLSPMEPKEQGLGARDRDEVSLLTDPSIEHAPPTTAVSRSGVSSVDRSIP